jgi:hypothetical protein
MNYDNFNDARCNRLAVIKNAQSKTIPGNKARVRTEKLGVKNAHTAAVKK